MPLKLFWVMGSGHWVLLYSRFLRLSQLVKRRCWLSPRTSIVSYIPYHQHVPHSSTILDHTLQPHYGALCRCTLDYSLTEFLLKLKADQHSLETRAHVEMELWPDVEDPASQHPMANRMIHIRQTLDRLAKETGKAQPHIKAASYVAFTSRRTPHRKA